MRRRRQIAPESAEPGFGVGMQVHVTDDPSSRTRDWVGEPTGVIVSRSEIYSDIGHGSGNPLWLVEFDEPQYLEDGRGPYQHAPIRQERLVAALPLAGDEDRRER